MERAWIRTGEEPQALQDQPELDDDSLYLLKAYRVIARERPPAFKLIPGITLAAIERYLVFWPEHDPVMFAELMMAIDDEWRATQNSEIARNETVSKGKK